MKELKIRPIEEIPGYEEGEEAPPGQANRRSGPSIKLLMGEGGELLVAVPRATATAASRRSS